MALRETEGGGGGGGTVAKCHGYIREQISLSWGENIEKTKNLTKSSPFVHLTVTNVRFLCINLPNLEYLEHLFSNRYYFVMFLLSRFLHFS